MSPTGANLGVSAMRHHEEYYFRDGNICFMVENTVFRLHRHFVERESEYFRARLNPSSEGEDGSPDSPYVIHDVSSDDFAQFIWVWYNPRYSFSKQTKEKWLTILRLATTWKFGEIRKLAVRHLEKIKIDPIEKITTYKAHLVDGNLLLPSYVSLSVAEKLPSSEEARVLGMDVVLKLAGARERLLLRASELGRETPPSVSRLPEDVVKAIVAGSFELPFRSTVQTEGQMNGNAPGDSPVDTPKQNKNPRLSNGNEVPQPWPGNDQGAPGGSNKTGKRKT